MTDCEFCDVLAGTAAGPPFVFETDDFVSMIGRFQPTGPGYSIVLPRRHVNDLHALDASELAPMLDAVRRVSSAVMTSFEATGTTIMQNNGEPGQSIRHLHFHVVPRYPGDGFPRTSHDEVAGAELARQAEVLRQHLR